MFITITIYSVIVAIPYNRTTGILPLIIPFAWCTCGLTTNNQFPTIAKSTIPYVHHAVRDCNGYQSTTTIERIIAYTRHAVRDDHGRQFAAPPEGIRIYARHTFRNVNISCERIGNTDEFIACFIIQNPVCACVNLIIRIHFY